MPQLLSKAQWRKFKEIPRLRPLFKLWQAESPVKYRQFPERLHPKSPQSSPRRRVRVLRRK
jgi:hypothetical protein